MTNKEKAINRLINDYKFTLINFSQIENEVLETESQKLREQLVTLLKSQNDNEIQKIIYSRGRQTVNEFLKRHTNKQTNLKGKIVAFPFLF